MPFLSNAYICMMGIPGGGCFDAIRDPSLPASLSRALPASSPSKSPGSCLLSGERLEVEAILWDCMVDMELLNYKGHHWQRLSSLTHAADQSPHLRHQSGSTPSKYQIWAIILDLKARNVSFHNQCSCWRRPQQSRTAPLLWNHDTSNWIPSLSLNTADPLMAYSTVLGHPKLCSIPSSVGLLGSTPRVLLIHYGAYLAWLRGTSLP